jgi:hypothetical protein
MAAAVVARQGERRKDIEAWLTEHGVDWEYVARFALEEVDREASLANQARIGEPLDPALVESYRDALANEAVFPALVLARPGARSYAVMIDGNHRFEAARLEELDSFGSYVVRARPTSANTVAMTYEANTRHGKPTSAEERVQQALWLHNNNRLSVEAAASAVNVSASTVRSRLDRQRADDRAVDVGVRRQEWDTMPLAVRARLNVVSTDEGFKATSRLAFQAQLSAAETDELVRAVNAAGRSAAKQEQVVRQVRGDYRARIAETAGGKARRGGFSPSRRFSLAVSNVLALPADLDADLNQHLDDEERTQTAGRARDAAARLTALADALER